MDNNVYAKGENGRYYPFGVRYDENYLPDGIYYIHHTKCSHGYTNVDRYLSGIFKVGEAKIPDFTKVCGEYELS